MTDEEADEILRTARETLDRLAAEPPYEPRSTEDPFERWERMKPKPEPPKRERRLDTAPIDWHAEVERAIAAERAHMLALLPELVAELRTEASDSLAAVARALRTDLANLQIKLGELYLAMANEKAEKSAMPVDLPSLPLRGGLN